ncbi:MAG: ZIP family metal transporter [Candidatus Thermoplasmatota archaeon]|nr:ZIP family metal transporter [Candidatus Thermoplasmatota archaeon]
MHDHHSHDHEIYYEDDVTSESNIACTHHLHTTSQAAFAGVAFHNFIEGIVLTMLFLNPETGVISWIVLLAIILHKAPCTLSITSLMKMGGYSSKTIKRGILILLAMTPLGIILTLLAFVGLDEIYIGIALAFSTGIFLEIGVLDLIPESMKEKIGRTYAIIAFLAGFGLLFLFSFFS